MGERKVLNNYIPPDMDPSIIPRVKRDRTKMIEVRTMLPFSMRCGTCAEYMYRGKKFNSRMERIEGEDYMGIRKFRFYIKCCVCSAEIAFKTDPKNSDYEIERGASRNFELWRDNEGTVEDAEKLREEEDKVDAMKALENRTMDSKLEMDVLDALDEMKAINRRHERVDTTAVLNRLQFGNNGLNGQGLALSAEERAANKLKQDEEDEVELKAAQFKRSCNNSSNTTGPSSQDIFLAAGAAAANQKTKTTVVPKPLVVINKRRRIADPASTTHSTNDKKTDDRSGTSDKTATTVHTQAPPAVAVASTVTSMFGDYASGSDSD